MLKKIVNIFCLVLLLSCSNNGPNVHLQDEILTFSYQGKEVLTNFHVDKYHVKREDDNYIIQCMTVDDHKLNIKFNKSLNGNIEIEEIIDLKDYHYSYKIKGIIKDDCIDFKQAIMKGEDHVKVVYDSEYDQTYCRYKGYVDIQPIKDIDTCYLNSQFYVTEEGMKRCEIDKKFSIVLLDSRDRVFCFFHIFR